MNSRIDDPLATPAMIENSRPPPLHKNSRDTAVLDWLRFCRRACDTGPMRDHVWVIDDRIYSWDTRRDRQEVLSSQAVEEDRLETAERGVLSEFPRHKWPDRAACRVRVALFVTTMSSSAIVNNTDYAKMPMHAWLAMILKTPPGQPNWLVVWDSNGRSRLRAAGTLRVAHVLLGRQLKLYRACDRSKHRGPPTWYGGDGNDDQDCLSVTTGWLLRLCRGELGEITPARLQELGFVQLVR